MLLSKPWEGVEHEYGMQAIDEDDWMMPIFTDCKAIEKHSSIAPQPKEAMAIRSSL